MSGRDWVVGSLDNYHAARRGEIYLYGTDVAGTFGTVRIYTTVFDQMVEITWNMSKCKRILLTLVVALLFPICGWGQVSARVAGWRKF